MARERESTTITDNGREKTVEVEVEVDNEKKTVRYVVPSSTEVLVDFLRSLPLTADGGSLNDIGGGALKPASLTHAYNLFVAATDARARATLYKSIAQESTVVSIGKERVDLMTFPLNKLVKFVNGMIAAADAKIALLTDLPPGATPQAKEQHQAKIDEIKPRYLATVARKLSEQNKVVVAADGTIRPK